MTIPLRHALTAAVLGAAALSAHAQVDQVKVWAAACANCHGTNGHAQPGMEALAGKDKDDLTQKLLDFKAGRKPATIMHQLAKGYSDDELRAIAAYFAAQKK
ncbi:Cytochrome subunit of sulfide dehydrogenase [Tepidimonas sediminis]|uniref:Cytochrome subunit of sulfide dehydrogenase n=1 Tax=Tepidimonas sediminis TaxID=2588941 RepID=A0A554WNZ1_9BURK|nr:c-type cytochrome [Tepidimonas sediminis]TSE25289.1 Cytochrome subunit of sulfide dehydrogenase [Tepidimonas sediminis]